MKDCYEDRVGVLFPILPTKYSENPQMLYINKHKETMREGRRAKDIETLGTAHGGFSGLSVCLAYLRLGVREANNPQMPS